MEVCDERQTKFWDRRGRSHLKAVSVVIVANNIYQIYPIVDRFYVLSRGRGLGRFKKGQVTPEEIIEILVGDHNGDET